MLMGLVALLCGCSKVQKTFTWTGEKEIKAEGGTVVWTPEVKGPHHWPEITAVVARVENVSGTEIIESEIIENPELPIEGEWYKVTGKLNEVIIDFKPNTTPYSRSITIHLDNPPGGYAFGVSQKSGIQ